MKRMQPKYLLGTAAFAALLNACGGSSSNGTSSASLSLSGTLAATGSSAKVTSTSRSGINLNMRGGLNEIEGGGSSLLVNYTALHIHCVTSDSPPVEVTGTIGTDGKFSVAVPNGANKGLSCSVLDSSDSSVAAFVLKDTNKKDMNGNPKVNSNPAFSGNTSLGSLTMDLDSGDVTIPASQVATSLSSSGSSTVADAFDPTGSWTIGSVDFPLPKGHGGPCVGHSNDCNGPPAGQKLYLKRIQGTDVSDSSTVFGLQVWQDESGGSPQDAMNACGGMTGLNTADAAKAGVDLSSYGSHNGAFAFATTVTDPNTHSSATISNGYQLSSATAQYTMQACAPKAITSGSTTINTYVCGPDASGGSPASPGGRYNASVGGGCKDSSGHAVSNIDWSQVTWGNGNSCTSSLSSIPGFYKNSCTATYKGTTITCANEWGVFNDANLSTAASGTANNPPAFNYATVPNVMTAGSACSTISGSYPLAKANCFAQYYQNVAHHLTGCLPRVDMDWSASTAADFAKINFRPQSLVFMEKLSYNDSSSASMLTEQTQNWGVEVRDSTGNSQWVNCAVVEKGGLSFKKINDGKILATYVSSTINKSTEKPACVGAPWNGQNQKFLFYLTK